MLQHDTPNHGAIIRLLLISALAAALTSVPCHLSSQVGPSARSPVLADLDSFRQLVQRHAKHNPRGQEGVAALLQIIGVLDAKTDAEYRARARTLPVTIVTSPGRNSDGQEGVWRLYRRRLMTRLTSQRPVPCFVLILVCQRPVE